VQLGATTIITLQLARYLIVSIRDWVGFSEHTLRRVPARDKAVDAHMFFFSTALSVACHCTRNCRLIDQRRNGSSFPGFTFLSAPDGGIEDKIVGMKGERRLAYPARQPALWRIAVTPAMLFASMSGAWVRGRLSRRSAMRRQSLAQIGSTITAMSSSGSGPSSRSGELLQPATRKPPRPLWAFSALPLLSIGSRTNRT
jgi:hypothetical protein